MEKEITPLDLYQQEVGASKPQTNEEAIERFNELLHATDDHFLKGGIVHSNAIGESPKETNK